MRSRWTLSRFGPGCSRVTDEVSEFGHACSGITDEVSEDVNTVRAWLLGITDEVSEDVKHGSGMDALASQMRCQEECGGLVET